MEQDVMQVKLVQDPEPRKKWYSTSMAIFIWQAVVTLLFTSVLAVYVNYRFDQQAARSATILAMMKPEMKKQKAAYMDFRGAAQDAQKVLSIYFPDGEPSQWTALEDLEIDLGIGRGLAATSWTTKQDVIEALRRLIALREAQEYLAPSDMKRAEDSLIGSLIRYVREGSQNLDSASSNRRIHQQLDEAFSRCYEKLRKTWSQPV